MSDTTNVTPFVGFDDTAKALPTWYQKTNNYLTPTTAVTGLRPAIDALPTEASRPMAYRDEQTDEWVEVNQFRVMVNPAWEGDAEGRGPNTTAAWYPTTDVYDPLSPQDGYGPLADALEDVDRDGVVFGQAREYRHGGKVHLDVFHTGFSVDFPDETDADGWIMGLQVGHDFFQQTSPYATVIAIDPSTGTVHRGLSDRRHRRRSKPRGQPHGSTMADLAAWWDAELERMDAVSDALYQVVFDALDYGVSTADLPVAARDVMTAQGFPDGLADHAVSVLPGHGERDEYSAWAYHAAMSDAVTHAFDGQSDGTAERSHVRMANLWLFDPARAERDALDDLYDQLSGQVQLDGWDADGLQSNTSAEIRATIRDRLDDVAQKTDDFRTHKQRLRAMIDAAGESDGDSDDDGSDDAAQTEVTA